MLQIETVTELSTKLFPCSSPQPALIQHVDEPERSPSPTLSNVGTGIHYTGSTDGERAIDVAVVVPPHTLAKPQSAWKVVRCVDTVGRAITLPGSATLYQPWLYRGRAHNPWELPLQASFP